MKRKKSDAYAGRPHGCWPCCSPGPCAAILSTISGDDTQEYTVEIVRLCPANRDGRDLLLKVTDPRLLEATGGIVQGM